MNFTESLRFLGVKVRPDRELEEGFEREYPADVDSRVVIKPGVVGYAVYKRNVVEVREGTLTVTERRYVQPAGQMVRLDSEDVKALAKPGEKLKIPTRLPGLKHLFKASK